MILSVLLKCALEETRSAWVWRLSSASLKDRRKIEEEETWSQLVSSNILGSFGRRNRQPAERWGFWGLGVSYGNSRVLLNFLSTSFFEIPSRWQWFTHLLLPASCGRHVVPCWVAAPSLCRRKPCTAPCGSLRFRLGPKPTLPIPLLGRACMIWSAVVIRQSLHSPPCWGQVWDHMEELLLAAVWM